MKLVILSDNHNNYRFDVPHGDILIHCGDFTFSGSNHEIEKFKIWIQSQPHKYKLFIWGNHELIEHDENFWKNELEEVGAICLHNTEVQINGVQFFGSSFTPIFGDWAFMHSAIQRKKYWENAPNCDVLITHGPPSGILSQNYNNIDCGCEFLNEYILKYKPKLHAFGHIHEAHGLQKEKNFNTTFANVSILDEGYRMINKPMIFEI